MQDPHDRGSLRQLRKIAQVAANVHRQLSQAGLQPSSTTLTMTVHPEGGLTLKVRSMVANVLPPWLMLPDEVDRSDLAWLMNPSPVIKDELTRRLRRCGWVCDWQ